MTTRTFPKALEAAKEFERATWALGDALLEECGPPPKQGNRDGSKAIIEECAVYLAERGFPYSVNYLQRVRGVAHHWPPSERVKSMAFSTHYELKSPKMYRELMQAKKAADGDDRPKPPKLEEAREFIAETLGRRTTGQRLPWQQFEDSAQDASDAGKRALALVDAHDFNPARVEAVAEGVLEEWQDVLDRTREKVRR